MSIFNTTIGDVPVRGGQRTVFQKHVLHPTVVKNIRVGETLVSAEKVDGTWTVNGDIDEDIKEGLISLLKSKFY